MNLINRIIVILLVILLWAAIVLVAAVPGQALAWARQGIDWVEASLAQLGAMEPGWLYPLLRGATIIVVSLLGLAWLMQELRRKQTPVVKMRLPSGGEAAVTADSISRRLAWHIDQLADVNSVTPVVRTRGNSVDVDLNLQTAPDVDVPMKTEEVVAVTRDVIETQMGLQMNKVKVNIDHAPYKPAL
jgi:hypothetical protein